MRLYNLELSSYKNTPIGSPRPKSELDEPSELRGKKRPYLDLALAVKGLLKISIKGYYKGRNIEEYHAFILQIESYFDIITGIKHGN